MPTAPDPERQFDVVRYDQWFDCSWGRYASSVERRAFGQFVPTDAQRMLDVGCGTGRLTLGTASGTVIGVDYDFDMLKLAQRRLGDQQCRRTRTTCPSLTGALK